MRAFFQDFSTGLFNFEGKIWRTLPMLAWSPGEMTRRYIAGERARFISPVALYLFTVFAMFAVLNFTGSARPHGTDADNSRTASRRRSPRTRRQLAKLRVEAKGRAPRRQGRCTDIDPQDRQATRTDIAEHRRLHRAATTRRIGTSSTTKRRAGSGPSSRTRRENPEGASMKVQDAAIEIQLAADPDVGALHVAAVPASGAGSTPTTTRSS